MLYVADTHSIIWFLTDDKKIGNKAKEILDKADEGKVIIIIPTIVLAELVFICEKKKASIQFKGVIDKINKSSNYIHYNLDMKVISEILNLTQIPEMHDRVIVATAKLNRAMLITKDRKIRDSNIVDVIWD